MEKRLFLLGLLRKSEMYGYQITELIKAHFDFSIAITTPTAYRLLRKMAEDGWITYRDEKVGNRPERRVYSITGKGEVTFQKLLRRSLASYQPADHVSTVSMAFLTLLLPEESLPLLEQRKQSIEKYLEKLKQIGSQQMEYYLVVENHQVHVETELAWIQKLIEKVRSGSLHVPVNQNLRENKHG
ncbi:MAG: PadR family transcriptional regulator [Anaerolineales bacterium]|nr:PadR family transcriptional regulator [Anaerolineales bacterium]